MYLVIIICSHNSAPIQSSAMICECVLCHHNSYFLHQDSSRQSLLCPHGGVKSAWYSSTAAIIVTFTLREHQTSDSGQYLDGIAIGQCSASRHVSNVWNGEYNTCRRCLLAAILITVKIFVDMCLGRDSFINVHDK